MTTDLDGRGEVPVVIYARASQDRALRGRSTASQIKRGEDEIDYRNERGERWRLIAPPFVDDNLPASEYSSKTRPGWQAVLSLIDSGQVRVLIINEASRASRSDAEQAELIASVRARRVHLCVGGEVYDLNDANDRIKMRGAMTAAADEVDRLSARVTRGKKAEASDGRPGGEIPFGYVRAYSDQDGTPLNVIDEKGTAEVVRRMVALVLNEGLSAGQVARRLNADGVPLPKAARVAKKAEKAAAEGRPIPTSRGWSPQAVRRVLQGPAQRGLRKHQREPGGPVTLYDAQWDAIIDAETAERIDVAIAVQKATHNGNTREARFLLSFVAQCGSCGRHVGHRTYHGDKHAYHCLVNGGASTAGHVFISPMETVDRYVGSIVAEHYARPEVRAVHERQRAAVEESERVSPQALREQIREAEANLATFAERAAADPELLVGYSALARATDKQMSQWRAQIARAEADRATPPPTEYQLALADDPHAAWDAMSLAQQRAELRASWRITLHPAGADGRKRSRGGVFDFSRVTVERTGL
ncbi:recombinase family protein [Cellulomonas fimi]|uniref:recombinase family protein n=1 Tax=Cellulomonas fimi TaxID=1708 RepID=UPI00234E0C9C|nr:recombinase family protein [Cellulomonas fimi]MDC7120279.1 recombinase family protein [Cellulomonas fimi]